MVTHVTDSAVPELVEEKEAQVILEVRCSSRKTL